MSDYYFSCTHNLSALCFSPDIVLTEEETHSSYDFILFDASVLRRSQIIKQRVCVCASITVSVQCGSYLLLRGRDSH